MATEKRRSAAVIEAHTVAPAVLAVLRPWRRHIVVLTYVARVNGQVEVPAVGQVKVPAPCGSSVVGQGFSFRCWASFMR